MPKTRVIVFPKAIDELFMSTKKRIPIPGQQIELHYMHFYVTIHIHCINQIQK